MPEILLATHNQGKIREYRGLLAGLPNKLITLADLGITLKVPETGASFEDNAVAKAKTYFALSRLTTLSEDSGLEVDALNGEPGVLSARYAGEQANDIERVDYLLSRMKGIPWDKRSARFRCVIAVALPGDRIETFNGVCEGVISLKPGGNFGFGYDPVFYMPEMGKTMAELPQEVKNKLSHRFNAAQKALHFLEQYAKEEIRR